MPNPFVLEAIRPGGSFCDREREKSRLVALARSGANVVLSSPRRYGKTSLVFQAQDRLAHDGALTIFANLLGTDSVFDVASRVARAVYSTLHRKESLLDKGTRYAKALAGFRPVIRLDERGAGISVEAASKGPAALLESVFEDIGHIAASEKTLVNVALDEFQDICRIKQSGQIEGVIRGAIQGQKASYIFPGSRRGILLAMFNDRKRPFFQSAEHMSLPPLPLDDATRFVQDGFASAGKHCPGDVALALVNRVEGHPYYVQRMARELYDINSTSCAMQDLDAAMHRTLSAERYGYEAELARLSPPQMRVLKALAAEPAPELLAEDFLARCRVPPSTVSFSAKRLKEEDLIEQSGGHWRVVDPVFASWLVALTASA